MKKRFIGLVIIPVMLLSFGLMACGKKTTTWKVTCPWAPSGVAAMVNQKAAALSTTYSDDIILVADAIKGDAATVNTWISSTKGNDLEMVFVNEGLLAITPILDPAKIQFTYEDFIFVENLYSAIFVMSADANLAISSLPDLEEFLSGSSEVTVAVNGSVGSEAFLAAALFGSMGYSDQLKLVAYSSAAEAAQAVAKGETSLAVSHQSQILEACQQGGVTIVCAFDEGDIMQGPFAGVEGVGKYGCPYFPNRCFIAARAGTDTNKVQELKELFGGILADDEMRQWMTETMMIVVDPMGEEDVRAHLENVRNIVNEYKELVTD